MSASESAPLAPTLREILGEEDLALLFREFLHQLKCAENLSFYVEVEEYKTLESQSERSERATKIWNKFLSNESMTPINIDSKCRQRIQSALQSGEIDVFDEASEFVYGMLSFDCYRKFIASETYNKWLSAFPPISCSPLASFLLKTIIIVPFY